MKKFSLIFLCLFSVFAFSGCKKSTDLQLNTETLNNYNITLTVNTEEKHVSATQTLSYINNSNTPLNEIKFHVYPQFFNEECINYVVSNNKMNEAFPNGMDFCSFEITRIQANSKDKEICFDGEHNSIIAVNLDSSLSPNERIELSFEYNFSIPNCEHRFGYGDNTINLANFYPIACVFEDGEFNTNPYNSNGDPFYSDISNYSVSISANNSYIVAGTGEKTDSISANNLRTTTFKASGVRDFALVLSNKFEIASKQVDNTLVEYYYFDDTNFETNLKASVDALTTFNKLFGKYPYKTLSIVKNDFIYGGMEYPTLVMISADIENNDDYMNVIIHEIAHQWWYGVVGNDEFEYPWLDEALTEYSTLLFYDYNEGYNFTHDQLLNINKENYSLFVSVYEEVLGSIDTSMRAVNEYATEPEYTYCTYVKGVLMYESLYQLIGEKNFIESLKVYYSDNAYKNVKPESLILAFEQVTEKDMDNFFSSWTSGKVVIH